MADFEIIFSSHEEPQVRRISDGLTVPHDSPLAPIIVGGQPDGTLSAITDMLVKKGVVLQADVDAALAPVDAVPAPATPVALPPDPTTGVVAAAPAVP